MKNLIILLALCFALGSCSDSASSSASADNIIGNSDASGDVFLPLPETEEKTESSISISVLTADTLYFYDGTFIDISADSPKDCGFRCFTDGNDKVFYNDDGEPIAYEYMTTKPDFVAGDWFLKKIDPQTAVSLGAQARDHTSIYYENSEVNHWSLNQWEATGLIATGSGHVIAIDNNRAFRPVSSNISGIIYAGDLLIYDVDPVARTALIADSSGSVQVSWETNYFNSADQWLKSGGVWYSWNGYEFSGSLSENANALWSWNTNEPPVDSIESPVVIAAGTVGNLLYWVECNTGFLISYDVESNSISTVYRLYIGDGLRATGILNRDNLRPVIISGVLYFQVSGSIWKLDLASGVVQLFFAGVGEVEAW
jgi:hypothetical protein